MSTILAKENYPAIDEMISELLSSELTEPKKEFVENLKAKEALTVLNAQTLVKLWQESTGSVINPLIPVHKLET